MRYNFYRNGAMILRELTNSINYESKLPVIMSPVITQATHHNGMRSLFGVREIMILQVCSCLSQSGLWIYQHKYLCGASNGILNNCRKKKIFRHPIIFFVQEFCLKCILYMFIHLPEPRLCNDWCSGVCVFKHIL